MKHITFKPIAPKPKCQDCKWFKANGKSGICNLFSLKSVEFKSDLIRKNTDLCGPDAVYFKQK